MISEIALLHPKRVSVPPEFV